ncbi:hypothetical protein AB3S75_011938 [Citrus x aurantiifolia]
MKLKEKKRERERAEKLIAFISKIFYEDEVDINDIDFFRLAYRYKYFQPRGARLETVDYDEILNDKRKKGYNHYYSS